MRLTQKLVDHLNRVFAKSSAPVLALRLRHALGPLIWTVEDNVLRLSVEAPGVLMLDGLSGNGSESLGSVEVSGYTLSGDSLLPLEVGRLTIDLTAYTISSLADYIASLDGFIVAYEDTDELAGLSARILLDGTGRSDTSNGDHLYGYTSLLWVYMAPIAAALTEAAQQIDRLTLQMVPQTAEGQWLDEIGGYYACDRLSGETDTVYAKRIIASVGRPAGNNVAIEAAINTITGGLQARVTDAAAEAFTSPYVGTSYGLFDVVYDIDLEGTDDINSYTSRVTAIVEALRDAGTHMKSVLVSGRLADAYDTAARAADSMSPLTVSFPSISESAAILVRRHDGTYRRDGKVLNYYSGAITFDGSWVYGWNDVTPPLTYNAGGEGLTITLTIGGVVQPPESV